MFKVLTVRNSVSSRLILALICVLVFPTLVSGTPLEEKYSPRCPVAKDLIPLPFPNPKDCSSFFLCSNGKPLELQCSENLLFDARERECRNKESVSCNSQPGKPQPAFAVCPAVNGPDVVMFPHSVDCSMYYVCDHGIPYPRKCPAGLHYNRRLRVCDYKERAKCVLVFISKQ